MSETFIKEDSFHVKLPDGWSLIDSSPDAGLWVYQSSSGDERLTISIKYFTNEPEINQIKESIDVYTAIRKQSSTGIHQDISISPDEFKEYPNAFTNIFMEKGPIDRLAANKTIATKVGIANFYYESYQDTKAFMQQVKVILSTTGFAS
ncbi:hypothetical protein [Motilimonas eburnea]|uniref:hypothetical protein n=1 Tax=Motilimonas eburnea TaxID=1737488 RepID=UPI001E3597EA|nr:hypothetical protein [Motilimonas eburnea]MCE2570944.1 hypothetical protein [Motilimonas eburnea]